MPDSTKIVETVQDWWAFLTFLLGSIASFWMGTKRSQWQLQQAREDIRKMDERLRQAESAYLHQLRQRGDCADEARACFAAMIAACYEIEARCE